MNVHRIPLTTGGEAIVDKADADLVAGFNWRRSGNGYVIAERGRMVIALHRLIIGAGPDDLVDHANRDPFDNRRCNLRFATKGQNAANAVWRNGRGSSRHRGVSWDKRRERWKAHIRVDSRNYDLGRFDSEDEAARVWNQAALEAWGEFARLNDVPEQEGSAVGG